MDAQRHHLLARRLIDAVGGLEAAAYPVCRLSKTQLGRIGQDGITTFMPADVIADLERACGSPIYSQAIAEASALPARVECLMTAGMLGTEAAAELQREIRGAAKDGVISPAEATALRRRVLDKQEQLRELDAAIVAAAVQP